MARPKRPSTKWASRSDTEAAAHNWSDAVLTCRTLSHAFEQVNATYVRRYRYWHVEYECQRGCGVKKSEEWSQGGVVLASWLVYPRNPDGSPAYLTDGIGRIAGDAKGALRIERVTRRGFVEQGGRASQSDLPRSSMTRKELNLEG